MNYYKPYTYLIKHIPTNKFYYGVRWKNVRLKICAKDDLWITYFTRSKLIKELIEKYGKESFLFEIRREFDTIEQARKWETKVLKRMKVVYRQDLWLNMTDNKAIYNEIHPRGTLGKTWKQTTNIEHNKKHKKGNTYTKNTFWIHNGKEKRMIPIGDKIPDGFVKGTGRTNKRPDLALRNKMRAKKKDDTF
jgi:hypothetical protein